MERSGNQRSLRGRAITVTVHLIDWPHHDVDALNLDVCILSVS